MEATRRRKGDRVVLEDSEGKGDSRMAIWSLLLPPQLLLLLQLKTETGQPEQASFIPNNSPSPNRIATLNLLLLSSSSSINKPGTKEATDRDTTMRVGILARSWMGTMGVRLEVEKAEGVEQGQV